VAGGQISPSPIDFHRRPYNTLALPCERVMHSDSVRAIVIRPSRDGPSPTDMTHRAVIRDRWRVGLSSETKRHAYCDNACIALHARQYVCVL